MLLALLLIIVLEDIAGLVCETVKNIFNGIINLFSGGSSRKSKTTPYPPNTVNNFCVYCGSPVNDPDAVYCRFCGRKIK